MDRTEQKIIRLDVSDELKLYTPFNPEAEFSESVKKYIKSKAAIEKPGQSFILSVTSRKTLDEERFRAAVADWIREEKALFRIKEQSTILTLLGLLVFGSVFIMVSLALQNQFEVLKYSLLPILGSLSLSKATGILILDMPMGRAQRRIINEMEKKNVVTFEYAHEENTTPDKGLV